MTATIHYIASNLPVAERFASLAKQEGFLLQLLHNAGSPWEDRADWEKVNILLLFTPFLYEKHYIAAGKIWAHYLRTLHPGVRFFTAGYSKVQPGVNNHLDLLNLPGSLSDFFLYQAGMLPTQVVETEGLLLHDKLARFFDGHGKESIFDVLSDITRLLGMAEVAAQRHGDSFETIKMDFLNKLSVRWTELKNRWNNYYALLLCLPVATLLREADLLIAEADQRFMAQICTDERLYQGQTLMNLLHNIHKLLLKVRQSCL
ncbi:MAG: hypothetical protein HUU01_18475 [Saprospiraceae bacterium]|nr:hypothetical protein [Saprospiraceae bacterium]